MAGPNWIDRMALAIAPRWGLSRVRARAAAQVLARHYEGAASGRRTQNWNRKGTDANAALTMQIAPLRNTARDLVRNNSWARSGLRTIAANTVGWGIRPKATGIAEGSGLGAQISALWKRWAETTDCDADGRLTFYGLQKLAMRQIAEGGEVLIRRRWRRPEDGLAVPMQLQVLEADFLDHTRDHAMLLPGMEPGAKVLQGVEFDAIGRRNAYWLFDQHPGSTWFVTPVSKRYSTTDILHVYDLERAGQVRGVTWFAPGIVNMKDFDEYEDANLVAAKIQACFGVFYTDLDGTGAPLGQPDATNPSPMVESFEPGMIVKTPPGTDVKFATPPTRQDDGFSTRQLRKFAAGLGVTYEQLTGDYSQVNFSSARMGQIRHQSYVEGWRWDMLVPLFCDPAWAWFLDAARLSGAIDLSATAPLPTAQWTPPPTPMIDPNTEVLANTRRVRSLQATPSEIIREQGYDPESFLSEYASDMKKIHALGIISDADASETSATGQAQPEEDPAAAAGDGAGAAPKNGASKNGTVKNGAQPARAAEPLVLVVPDGSDRVADALRAPRPARTVKFNQDDKGRIIGATVSEEA